MDHNEQEVPEKSQQQKDMELSEQILNADVPPPETKHSPSDVAAAFFSMNERKLKISLQKLSARQLRRVIMNVVSYPLKGEYIPKSDDEKSAAYIFNEMSFNKNIMQLEMEMQRVESVNKEELDKLTNMAYNNTITQEENKEENNG